MSIADASKPCCCKYIQYIFMSACSDSDQYHVTVQSTEASRRCRLDGEYLFSLDGEAVLLLDGHTGDIIHRWPYKLLRKIGQFQV